MLNEVETECCQNSDGDYNIFHSLQWRIENTVHKLKQKWIIFI